MDPNANLREQEFLIDVKINSGVHASDRKTARTELRKLREALTDWLRSGGAKPDWNLASPSTLRYFKRWIR